MASRDGARSTPGPDSPGPDSPGPDSLRVLFADAHRNPPLARRAQVLSERQRAMNRSVLRLLAYPKPGCRQRLTGVKIAIFIARGWPARAMWDYLEKEWAVRGPGEGARSKPVLTTGLHSLALAQTLRSARRTQHFAGGPPGRLTKCGVSPHLPQIHRRDAPPWPPV